jgi:hypothetical protein
MVEAKSCNSVITSTALRSGGGAAGDEVTGAAAWVTLGGGPYCTLSFTARSFPVAMSARMAVEMAEATKLTTENGTMIKARMSATRK